MLQHSRKSVLLLQVTCMVLLAELNLSLQEINSDFVSLSKHMLL